MKRNTTFAALAAAAVTVGIAGATLAQQVEKPTATVTAPETASRGTLLSLNQIEALLEGQGIKVEELELKDRVVKAEGRDSSNREVEVIVDRRTGEILSSRIDD